MTDDTRLHDGGSTARRHGAGGWMPACWGRVCAVTLLAACTGAPAASYRFDMGGGDTPLASGYTLVTAETTLEKSPAFGWRLTVPQPRFYPRLLMRGDPVNPLYANDSSKDYVLYSDMVLAIGEITFEFIVAPGNYAVTAAVGDLSPGEGRPGNAIWANGVQVVSGESTDGQVKAFTFPVDAVTGKITLRFRADSAQKYVQIAMVAAEWLAPGQSCVPAVVVCPSEKPGPAVYRKNWAHFQAKYVAKWEQIRNDLMAEDPGFKTWRRKMKNLRQSADYRRYYAIPNGFPYWRRMDDLAQGITLEGFCRVFGEMGLDGLAANDAVVAREFAKQGLSVGACCGGEKGFFGMVSDAYVQNLLMDAAGKTSTVAGAWSSHDPKLLAEYRAANLVQVAPALPGAAFLCVDEPRGDYCSGGRYGDHSVPAQAAFKRWAAGKGYAELAQKGIPPRGRTMDFYRYYHFRMESPGLFTAAVLKDVAPTGTAIMVGQGDAGPQGLNHNSFFPTLLAQSGFDAATWTYGTAAENKMYAEAVSTAEECGRRSCLFPPLELPEWFWRLRGFTKYTPADALSTAAAGISAANNEFIVYELFMRHIDDPGWIKALYYQARLAHAMTGLTHAPPLRVWWPESQVYSDLVELNDREAQCWKKLTQVLFDANVDYKVTNLLKIPKESVLLYACVRPVLSAEEFARLQGFVEGGGMLLAAFQGVPEFPDGTPIAAWAQLPASRVIRIELASAALGAAVTRLGARRNWMTESPAVKTCVYESPDGRVHLLNNTDADTAVAVTVPVPVRDVFTGRKLKADAALTIPPGHHALLRER